MDFTSDLGLGGSLTVYGANSDGAVTNADVELTDADGKRWSATVLTLAEIDRLMGVWESSDECQGGSYLRVPDLLIVRDPERDAVVRLFVELHRTGEHRHELSPLSDD
ncbi:hypothetical protein [Nocardioides rubriscoriae]|uniref:hypothetical protein n=1 Tax=Nocardioides rubriscoriae TaxID=642762 RepID=UPI0011DF9F65|nr:hypothetical protein [Nocardioides rubriscoriae]